MMWDGFNKRKFPRLNLQCEIEIQSEVQSFPVIQTITENVGMGGVCVIVDQSLGRFNRCRLRLELNHQPDKQVVECSGKVVWIIATRDIRSRKIRYDTGIEFMDIESDTRKMLKAYLEEHARKMNDYAKT